MSIFKREQRYIVIKLSDLREMPHAWQEKFENYCTVIAEERAKSGKRPLQCVVVEDDWPNYDHVWDTVEQVAEGAWSEQPRPAVPEALLREVCKCVDPDSGYDTADHYNTLRDLAEFYQAQQDELLKSGRCPNCRFSTEKLMWGNLCCFCGRPVPAQQPEGGDDQ